MPDTSGASSEGATEAARSVRSAECSAGGSCGGLLMTPTSAWSEASVGRGAGGGDWAGEEGEVVGNVRKGGEGV